VETAAGTVAIVTGAGVVVPTTSGRVVVTSKIAVLAALHIADELFRLREERAEPAPQAEAASVTDEARLARLVERLDAVLTP
jgi:cell division protein ZapA (FtsZ GTPase activity inhibitor)